jgi:deoxyribodipyrimidine photo-lyase
VYWIHRDQRITDNWAFTYAQQIAIQRRVPLHLAFCVVPQFLNAAFRQYHFMLRGLRELELACREHGMSFTLLEGHPPDTIAEFVRGLEACLLVTDFQPLRISRTWVDSVVASTNLAIHQVDAHNIVPCWVASEKQEFGAYTLRPKLHRLLPTYLESLPTVKHHPYPAKPEPPTNWDRVEASLIVNRSVAPVQGIEPGMQAAQMALDAFVERLHMYEHRNNPLVNGQSGLSPYLHFGQISAQRVALEIQHAAELNPGLRPVADAFLEELIVRRELSDNFTFYNQAYDRFEGFPAWAQLTLNQHRADAREYVYTLDAWEQADTHDALWNAAQRQLARTGTMHGYLRMYWAKKILEWTATPEEAMSTATYLNDAYQLDGCDPNGYAGIAWSIGGVHDRAWAERAVFGKIRYMNANGCRRKFNVDTYIATYA